MPFAGSDQDLSLQPITKLNDPKIIIILAGHLSILIVYLRAGCGQVLRLFISAHGTGAECVCIAYSAM